VNDDAGKQADRYAASHQPKKFQHSQARSRALPGDHQGNRKLQCEQTTGIVDQAFAFQYVNNSPGKAEALGNCGGSNRIRGRDYGSQDSTHPVVKPRNQPGRAHCNAKHSKSDQAKGQHKNADNVFVKVAPGSVESTDEEQRRQNHQKNNVRIQRDLRQVAEE
jgi:hypothetical protein